MILQEHPALPRVDRQRVFQSEMFLSNLTSQTAGSISRPSSFCGVWGMKPSFGLLPRTGVLKTSDTLDTLGFITSRVDNLHDILDIMRVKGPNYPYVFNNVEKN